MEEKNSLTSDVGGGAKKRSAVATISGAVAAGGVFAWHWPMYPVPGFIFGVLIGRKFMKPGPRGLLISLVYASACLLFHATLAPFPYSLLHLMNPAFFRMAIYLIIPTAVLWRANRAEWSAVLLCLILMKMLFSTNSEGVIAALGVAVFLAAAFKSGELNRLCIVPLALAVFHCYLFTGLFTYQGGLPQIRGTITSEELRITGFPGKTSPLILPHIKAEAGARAAGGDFGWGKSVKAVKDPAGGETYLQMAHILHSSIVGLDPVSYAIKRESFSKICGGPATDFDLSRDGRFMACMNGGIAVIIDSGSLEWLDTLKVETAPRRARVRFGPPGILYFSSVSHGTVTELKFDKFGHNLRMGRTLELRPGILSLAYLHNDHFLAAGDNLSGTIYVIDPDTMSVVEEKEIPPNLKMDEIYTDENNVLFRTVMDGKETRLAAGIIELLEWEPARGWKRAHGLAASFTMPVKLLRSTR